jgi:transglutaminase-like putative cysteine protease
MNLANPKRDWGTFLLYVFGFVLLWEWIRPLKELTDTGHLNVFIFYILLSFALAYFQTPIWISFPVKILYILNCVNFFYFKSDFFSLEWLTVIFNDLISNFAYVFDGQWTELTNVFRTIMFFLLLWLMTYLIHYWLLNRKRIFLFFFVTLIYITVLDTFTPYSAKEAIIRAIITGFAAMGILTLNRILAKENAGRNFSFSKKWLSVLTSLIVLSVSFGYIAPKAEPIWPDPVPYIKSMNEKSGGGGIRKIGYGVDDSKLGGPFVGDNKVVFLAEAESRHYWKVETKDLYTGKGWVISDDDNRRISIAPDSDIPIYSFEEDVEVKEQEAIILPDIAYPHIVYPFGVKQVALTDRYGILELDPILEKVYFEKNITNLNPYRLTYEVPNYSVTKLKEVNSSEQARLDAEFVKRYTQLPANLPPEIKQLAEEITAGQTSWFDKARAIERYFDRAIFSYSQKNVAIPAREEDYVAQFLFESRVGYCDNFSTSMAVMLRTIGIPTRWVKGYTAGEYKDLGSESRKIYEITNNNAHSWLEVYFPGSGWLAFEPTPGYTNNVSLNFDTYKGDTPKDETPVPEKKPEPEKPELKEDTKSNSKADFSIKMFWAKAKVVLNNQWHWFLFGGLFLAIIIYVLYQKRARWMPYYLILKFKFIGSDENLSLAYLALLRQLELYGLKRHSDQTLREYAKYVDNFFSTKEMSRLTDRYEQLLYNGTLKQGTWIDSKELWENLIKKTTA